MVKKSSFWEITSSTLPADEERECSFLLPSSSPISFSKLPPAAPPPLLPPPTNGLGEIERGGIENAVGDNVSGDEGRARGKGSEKEAEGEDVGEAVAGAPDDAGGEEEEGGEFLEDDDVVATNPPPPPPLTLTVTLTFTGTLEEDERFSLFTPSVMSSAMFVCVCKVSTVNDVFRLLNTFIEDTFRRNSPRFGQRRQRRRC